MYYVLLLILFGGPGGYLNARRSFSTIIFHSFTAKSQTRRVLFDCRFLATKLGERNVEQGYQVPLVKTMTPLREVSSRFVEGQWPNHGQPRQQEGHAEQQRQGSYATNEQSQFHKQVCPTGQQKRYIRLWLRGRLL